MIARFLANLPVEKWLDRSDPEYNKQWDSYLDQIVEFVNNWRENLKEKMHPEPEKVKDDW